ncbi:Disease resistance protein (CC-NBS-LRR class) family protein [Rhynchospora pubera]|uniref:Disease resistance protein (CC-NBS-LRR class) family protein n=1 Tax=Rhynchospora pubera TaxID=906938 RepID=A0AAV8F872_9POAL|nr:Disease resistance protein (CC-NBS-LRR class) family protein [Rhynchospora pubera]
MAESIVSFVLSKLADASVQELLHLCGVDMQVKLLSDELGWIQAFLRDADRKNNSGDERQRHWVKEMTEVAYDIEDAIDTGADLPPGRIYHLTPSSPWSPPLAPANFFCYWSTQKWG